MSMATHPISSSICSLLITLFCIIPMVTPSTLIVYSRDALYPRQPLVINHTLISANKRFELGFFKPSPNLTNRYLAIWYKDLYPLTVVWVANRIKPLKKSSPRLVLDENGGLSIQDGRDKTSWITVPMAKEAVVSPTLQLLDTGNLVVRDSHNNVTDQRGYIWESFNYPTDTLLPGMKLGWDSVTGVDRVMTSWKTSEDPSDGEYSFRFDSPGSPQLVLEQKMVHQYRWGPWDGSRFSGTDAFKRTQVYKAVVFIFNPEEISLMFDVFDDTVLFRFLLTSSGTIQLVEWNNRTKKWAEMVALTEDHCDQYALCGPNAVCHPNKSNCRCLKGFQANSPPEADRMDYTGGCKRKYDLNCSGGGDGFVKYEGLKLPDYSIVWKNLSPSECPEKCLKDCNCMAYTNLALYGNGSQCVIWMGDLIDIKSFPDGGDEIYIRMAQHEIALRNDRTTEKEGMMVIPAFLTTITAVFLMCVVAWYICRIKKANIHAELSNNPYRYSMESHDEDLDFHIFDIETISGATNNFSLNNKIGQGGFGIVYKGELGMGQEIAVKRLLESSWQGLREFTNEVNLIARLQHRNLVKLLGYCIEGEEKLLVYEYLPNRSLDQFLFDQARKRLLTWEKRLNIIAEVAKGLVYLHDDSRLRIIHRDLKASNILLDSELNPKISDFGVARIFAEGAVETTRRVIGTQFSGYMSPEYIMSGHFSTRSDVFSFGVLAIEIISGKKNWGFHHLDHDMNLLGHAWKLWDEGKPMDLIDRQLEEEDSFSESEMLRYIQVSLLCVQQRAEDRPTMSSVVNMLRGKAVTIPEPFEPAFFIGRSSYAWLGTLSSEREPPESINDLTISSLSGR